MKRVMLILIPPILLAPLVINFGIKFWPFPSAGGADAWIGFWGSYLGIIASSTIAVAVFYNQIKIDKINKSNDLEFRLIQEDRNRTAEFLSICSEIRNSLSSLRTKSSLMDVFYDANRIMKLSNSNAMRDSASLLSSHIYTVYKKYEELEDKAEVQMEDYNFLQFKIRDFEDSVVYLKHTDKANFNE